MGSSKDYIHSAIDKKLNQIGLSDHHPMIFLPEPFHQYAMPLEGLELYFDEANALKELYKENIDVLIGLEVDYFKKAFSKNKTVINQYEGDFNYLIGSVHVIPWNEHEALPFDIEESVPIIKRIGIDKMFLSYYEAMEELVKLKYFDIIGHFDLPKKTGLVPEDNELIWQKTLSVIDYIEETNILVEINTSGLRNAVQEQYPSDDIIKELLIREIPLTLGSDAHSPFDIAYAFDETILRMKKIGLTKLYSLEIQNESINRVSKLIK
jgi:histidinol-phosphatase (PHP family)